MILKINKEKFISSFFMMFGMLLTFLSFEYSYGSLDDMGPGFFPRWIGIFIFSSGIYLFLKNFYSETQVKIPLKEPVAIISGILSIPLLYDYIGMSLASVVLVFLTTFFIDDFSIKKKMFLVLIMVTTLILIKIFFLPTLKL